MVDIKPYKDDTRTYLKWKYQKFEEAYIIIQKKFLEAAISYFTKLKPLIYFTNSFELEHITHNEGGCCICHLTSIDQNDIPSIFLEMIVCSNKCKNELINIFAEHNIFIEHCHFNGECIEGGYFYPDKFIINVNYNEDVCDNHDHL